MTHISIRTGGLEGRGGGRRRRFRDVMRNWRIAFVAVRLRQLCTYFSRLGILRRGYQTRQEGRALAG
jgi:hypothetical protein